MRSSPVFVRYLSCLRPIEILILQGTPLLGALFAVAPPAPAHLVPLAVLALGNIFLIAHVFVLNDWSNLDVDLADPNKNPTVFTGRGVSDREMGGLAAGLLVAGVLLFSLLGTLSLALALGIAVLSAFYSLPRFNWKGRPVLSSVAHLAGGAVHFLLGYSIGGVIDRRGMFVASFFALTFAAGHLVQELRDYRGDVRSAIRTNAVTFGPRRTFVVSLVLFGLAHVALGLLAIRHLIPGALGLVVMLFPVHLYWSFAALSAGLSYTSVCRLQARYRRIYALIGVVMVVTLWLA
jgi:4-hydroxybenzoate polyprenyltransferase